MTIWLDQESDFDSKSVLVFFVGQRTKELGTVKASEMGKIFGQTTGFRDVDEPFLKLQLISFFSPIHLVKTYLL